MKKKGWHSGLVLVLIWAMIGGGAGCAALSNTSSNPNTVSLPPSSQSSTTTTAPNVPEPGPFSGTGSESLGTITVPPNTVLQWSCPGCGATADNPGGDNFIITNNVNDPNQIDVNDLGQASGQTAVDGGTYHDVQVEGSPQGWTVTFSNPGSAPTSSGSSTATSTDTSGAASTSDTTTNTVTSSAGFTPGDQNPHDGHASDCGGTFEIGPDSDCSVAEQVANDVSNGSVSINDFAFTDTVTDNANYSATQTGATITFNCQAPDGPGTDYSCTSTQDPKDFFAWQGS